MVSADASVRIELTVATVVSLLDDVTDLAVLPDGQVLVAERSGQIRLFRNGAPGTAPALALTDVSTGDGRGLLSIAADRDFAANQFVYVLYTTGDGLRMARFRLAGAELVDRAILMEGLPVAATQPSAVVRMGPDRKLYLALDDGGSPSRAEDLGDLAGKLLRLNTDGTTPSDQPAGLPIRLSGLHRPSALAWSGESGAPWVADNAADGAPVLYQGSDGGSSSASTAVRVDLPATSGATALAGDAGATASRELDLLAMNQRGAHGLLRIARAPLGVISATTIAAPAGELTRARSLARGDDGTLYIGTAQSLLRLVITSR